MFLGNDRGYYCTMVTDGMTGSTWRGRGDSK